MSFFDLLPQCILMSFVKYVYIVDICVIADETVDYMEHPCNYNLEVAGIGAMNKAQSKKVF